ncbi:MAG: class I SAM-dependent methyltransferase [Pyrinomonadaceae bacterium]|nr:class I SAM-dependent methyltransferase [Pyrinomonadaceae bacterium]
MKARQILTGHALRSLFGQMHGGSFSVTYCDSTTQHFGDDEPQFQISFCDDSLLDLLHGDMLVNFGDAYMDGRMDFEGDLADLMSLALRSGLMSATGEVKGLAGTALRVVGKLRSLNHEKENIAHHYDLGNDFFSLWLDESLTYSCAYFHKTSDSLEQAQQQKIDHSLRKLRLKPDESLLDIGCGWGALVMRAAEHFGGKATGITLSEEQYAGASELIKARGMQGHASVRLMHYSSLAREEQFDKIVSIGMMEHVGKANLAEFTRGVETMLKPDGLALLHSITVLKEGPVNGWIEKHIFPGGYVPTLSEILSHLTSRDFRVWDVENLAPHYRMTLDHWSERFEQCVPLVRKKFSERFVRMWRLYLRASSAAFREGVVEVHQILVSRGQQSGLPLTREDLYSSSKHRVDERISLVGRERCSTV